jgi:hypothetical protein
MYFAGAHVIEGVGQLRVRNDRQYLAGVEFAILMSAPRRENARRCTIKTCSAQWLIPRSVDDGQWSFSRVRERHWRRSAGRSRRRADSLLTSFTGESGDFGGSETRPVARKRCNAAPFGSIPYANQQGNPRHGTGTSAAVNCFQFQATRLAEATQRVHSSEQLRQIEDCLVRRKVGFDDQVTHFLGSFDDFVAR